MLSAPVVEVTFDGNAIVGPVTTRRTHPCVQRHCEAAIDNPKQAAPRRHARARASRIGKLVSS